MVFPWWDYGVFIVWFVGVGLSAISGSRDSTRSRERKAKQWRKRNDFVDEQCIQVLSEENEFSVAMLNSF